MKYGNRYKIGGVLFVVSITQPFSGFVLGFEYTGLNIKLVYVLTLLVSLQKYSVFPSSDKKKTGCLPSCCLNTGAARDGDTLIIQLYVLLKPSATIWTRGKFCAEWHFSRLL